MRKEVKQSLLIWPALASASVVGLLGLSELKNRYWSTLHSKAGLVADVLRADDATDPYAWRELPQVDESNLLASAPPSNRLTPKGSFQKSECTITFGAKSVQSSIVGRKDISSEAELAKTLNVGADEVVQQIELSLQSDVSTANERLIEENSIARLDSSSKMVADFEAVGKKIENAIAAAMVETDRIVREKMPLIVTDLTTVREPAEEVAVTLTSPANATDTDQIVPLSLSDARSMDVMDHVDTAKANIDHSQDMQAATKLIENIMAKPSLELAPPAPIVVEPQVAESVIPKSVRVLADLARPSAFSEPVPSKIPNVKKDSEKVSTESAFGSPAGWPVAAKLLQDLEALIGHDGSASGMSDASKAAEWAQQVKDRLERLSALDRLGNSNALILIDELNQLSRDGRSEAESVTDRSLQIKWLTAIYDVQRRTAIWRPIYDVVSGGLAPGPDGRLGGAQEAVSYTVANFRSFLGQLGDAGSWGDYLLLDQIEEAAANDDADERKTTALRLLARVSSRNLAPSQTVWLAQDQVRRLVNSVRPWAAQAIDFSVLLGQIEEHESNSINFVGREIIESYQTLRFSGSEQLQQIAALLDLYYRNANIRVSVAEDLLQRLVPPVEPHTMPVQTSLFGSRVKGVSRVETKVAVDLVPAQNRLAIQMRTKGNVLTQSVGQNGGTSVNTMGASTFSAVTPMEISADGFVVHRPSVQVQGRTRLRGLQTQYDRLPILGVLANKVARTKYSEVSNATSRIANRRIKTQLYKEIDVRARERMALRGQQFSRSVIQPLERLALQPTVMGLQTTNDRMVTRYRLAGDWDLAANTARPRALRDSLISVQVHQTAINNLLQRLVPKENPKSVQQILNDGFSVFGRQDIELPDDMPEDVELRFTQENPITVQVEEGIVWLTLRVVKLTRGEKVKLTRFIVKAGYKPEINGLNASLVRDGHLRISGPGMSMRQRLPLRAIFNKVLSASNKIPLTTDKIVNHPVSADLEVSQLELRNGWIAIAVSDKSNRLAMR